MRGSWAWRGRIWQRFLKKHDDLKYIRLHDLRHTCATFLLSNNVPVATVSKKLGHSNIYTTLDVYTHPVDKDDIDASKLLNDIVKISLDNKIGRPLIQKLDGANRTVHADKMIFITTSDFSVAAIEFAQEANV